MCKLLIFLVVLAAVLTFGPLVIGQAHANANTVTIDVPSTDRDPCNDYEEQGDQPSLGGQRDPHNFWDFYDVPAGAASQDGAVAIGDVLAVVTRFGTNDSGGTATANRASDPLDTPVPALGYHPVFDRGGLLPGAQSPWNLAPPDGSITVGDIIAVVKQFGHRCEGPFTKTIDLSAECGTLVKDEGAPLESFELTDGQTHFECFLVKDPSTGKILDVRKVEVAADTTQEEVPLEEPEPLSSPSVSSEGVSAQASVWTGYGCSSNYKYESLIFRSDLAKVRLWLTWKVVKDHTNPYYGVVLIRETWKDVAAQWPWAVSDRHNDIDVTYPDPYTKLKATTWTAFHGSWPIPVPFVGQIKITEDMEIHVSVKAGLDGSGRATCWRTGYNT